MSSDESVENNPLAVCNQNINMTAVKVKRRQGTTNLLKRKKMPLDPFFLSSYWERWETNKFLFTAVKLSGREGLTSQEP
jgi:hypothetical protein